MKRKSTESTIKGETGEKSSVGASLRCLICSSRTGLRMPSKNSKVSSSSNPLEKLSRELISSVLTYVDPSDVLHILISTNRRMRRIIYADDNLWKFYTETLWSDKVYVPKQICKLHNDGKSREAFRRSILESRRMWIFISYW